MESKIRNQESTIGMSPGRTVSKLRSIPAPYLAQAPALKQGGGTPPHRGTAPTSPRDGPYLTETRTASRRDGRSAPLEYGPDLDKAEVQQ